MPDGVLPGLGALGLHPVERVVPAYVQVDVVEGQHPAKMALYKLYVNPSLYRHYRILRLTSVPISTATVIIKLGNNIT